MHLDLLTPKNNSMNITISTCRKIYILTFHKIVISQQICKRITRHIKEIVAIPTI